MIEIIMIGGLPLNERKTKGSLSGFLFGLFMIALFVTWGVYSSPL